MPNNQKHIQLIKERVTFRLPNIVIDWIQSQPDVSLTRVCVQAIYNLPEYQEWIKGQKIEGKPAIEFARDRKVNLLPDEENDE